MENKGQNTHLLFDCVVVSFVMQSSVLWLTYIKQLAFLEAIQTDQQHKYVPVCLIHFRIILYLLIVQHREIFVCLLLLL